MAMTWTSLLADKGVDGSIKTWVGYSRIDAPVILDEAQSLIYSALRVREMRTRWAFGVTAGNVSVALPPRFLDPIGRLIDITNNIRLSQRDQPVIEEARTYDSTVTGSMGTNPFTTTAGSSLVAVSLPAHGMTQASAFVPAGAAAVGGLNLNGMFEIVQVLDPNTFTISTGDATATSSATGGGSAVTYTADVLISGTAVGWAVFDEALQFDVALSDDTNFRLPYYRSPALLSATNQSNFLTNRYPKLLRVATTAAAAEMMKDDNEYSKNAQTMAALIQGINIENEMFMRGGDYGTDTPTPGDYY